jgi:hypothetical protein
VLAYFAPEVAISEGYAVVMGLIFTVGMVYGPGTVALIKRKSRERQEARKQAEHIEQGHAAD